jgi:hypothetical protein
MAVKYKKKKKLYGFERNLIKKDRTTHAVEEVEEFCGDSNPKLLKFPLLLNNSLITVF